MATQINVSTAFFPAAILPGSGGRLPDMIVHTTDSVFFYCHHSVLASRSTNMFGGLLATFWNSLLEMNQISPGSDTTSSSSGSEAEPPHAVPLSSPSGYWSQSPSALPTFHIPQDSIVFNIVLHAIYNLPFERYGPSLDTTAKALSCLAQYGIHLPDKNSSIWDALAKYASTDPIRVYTLAASQGADSVCVTASQYTLGASLTEITEDDALAMGPLPLRRLTLLHIRLCDTLKHIITWQPIDHETSETCTVVSRKALQSAWQNSAADILFQDLPQNTTNGVLTSAFCPLSTMPQCRSCKRQIQMRIATVLQDWAMVKRTI
ncbi:hypothetical protein FRB99_000403 [Tulasnella sp. 403]|nr:hypothetical protein FRB99_000403 [Tulasnella sp. 403]